MGLFNNSSAQGGAAVLDYGGGQVNVKAPQLGAQGNGVATTDSAAIASGITNAYAMFAPSVHPKETTWNAGGGIVYAPPGNYYCGVQTLPWGTGVQGAGMMATSFVLPDATNARWWTNHQAVGTDPVTGQADRYGKFIFIKDCCLDGNRANNTSAVDYVIYPSVPSPGSPGVNDADQDSHQLFENVRIRNAPNNGIGNAGGSEIRWSNLYVDWANNYAFNPSYDSWLTNCTAGQTGQQGLFNSSPSIRAVALKIFYSGNITGSNGFGFNCASGQRGGAEQYTGCEAQDNKAHGFEATTCDNVSILGTADSNSVTSAGTYCALDMWDCRHCSFDIVCLERAPTGVATQLNAIQCRTNSRYNKIRLTHYAAVAANPVNGPVLTWQTTCWANDVSVNGATQGGSLQPATFAASFTPNPAAGVQTTESSATVFGGNDIKVTLTAAMTAINAVPADQRWIGQILEFTFLQDATGGRTFNTFNAIYHPNTLLNTAGTWTTTASTRSTFRFKYEDDSAYHLVGAIRTGDAN